LEPGVSVRIEIFKTTGDVRLDVPLSAIGGQGAFTKELEVALLDGRVDVAVHSLKDLPTVTPDGLAITATPEREDPRDALVLRAGSVGEGASLDNLAPGAVVGTSSLRRIAQLKHLRPDVRIKDLRGNVDTRLRKLDEGEYDALILASAGLRRLGLGARVSAAIPPDVMLPAVGQGSLGIETRADDRETNALVSRLDDRRTRAAVLAERALLRSLGGGCQVPIAAHATVSDGRLSLDGLVATLDGAEVLRDRLEGDAAEPDRLGEALAARLVERGASRLLDGLPVVFPHSR
ncbi:MAG TPA: hydroxymethylbilane synthase, partial [Pyrinomonadaceae bacterium]